MANRIYLCLAHMSETGEEQKYIKIGWCQRGIFSESQKVS